jgi:hypothetical protein
MTSAAAHRVTIREHAIPTHGAGPYILCEGPDGAIWFCQSTASRIGRLDPASGAITEFPLPHPDASPIGIIAGRDGCLWFTQKKANRIGRLTTGGELTEFEVPTPASGPDAIAVGPDGAIWFSQTDADKIGRIDASGHITEFSEGLTPGSRPLALVERDGALWFSQAGASRIGRIDPKGAISSFPIPSDNSQPRAIALHPAEPLPEPRLAGQDMLYSSGTTGRPKGAMQSQRAVFAAAVGTALMEARTAEDRIVSALPLPSSTTSFSPATAVARAYAALASVPGSGAEAAAPPPPLLLPPAAAAGRYTARDVAARGGA